MPKDAQPLPDSVRLGAVATGRGLKDVLDLDVLLLRRFVFLQCYAASQREHGADRRLGLVNHAVMILQQRAAADGALRQQADDRDPGVLADIALTVLLVEAHHTQIEFLRRPEQVVGREQNVLPVDAALAALLAVEAEGLIRADLHLVVVLCDCF